MNLFIPLAIPLAALLFTGCTSNNRATDKIEFPFDLKNAGQAPQVAQSTKPAPKPEYQVLSFKLIRTFHSPIVVTIENADTGNDTEPYIYALYQEYSGKGGYEWGHIQTRKGRRISINEWESILSDFKAIDFMELSDIHPGAGSDGSSWGFGGIKSGSSIEFNFHSPTNKPAYDKVVTLGKKMLQLANPNVEVLPLY